MLSSGDREALARVAVRLSVPPDWLYKLIKFETAGTFDPKIQNPNSTAKGLIQFLDRTARSLGYRDSLHLVNKHPDFAGQLEGPVFQYLQPWKPFPTKQSFYLSVFYPKGRKKSLSYVIPKKDQEANPGIVTIGDYVSKVEGDGLAGSGLTVMALWGAGLIAYRWFQNFKTKG